MQAARRAARGDRGPLVTVREALRPRMVARNIVSLRRRQVRGLHPAHPQHSVGVSCLRACVACEVAARA
eukprot:9203765-Alexandrium_andersonii.AAC.1